MNNNRLVAKGPRWRPTASLLSLVTLLGCHRQDAERPMVVPVDTAARSIPSASSSQAPWLRPLVEREGQPGEGHLRRIRQLTFAGENAEAYWSFDQSRLVFQSTHGDATADQIFVMPITGERAQLVSTGKGRTTCGFFLPGDQRVLFASTHLAGSEPPPRPMYDPKIGYVWPVFKSYAIVSARLDGSDLRILNDVEGAYDAEATVSPTGDRIVFTSSRDGDLEIYTMAIDGSDVRRLTHSPGYDGGPVFSPDGSHIAWRAPKPGTVDLDETRNLLDRQLVRPDKLEVWTMDTDGSHQTMLTDFAVASFAPAWHPDGKRIIFSSNKDDPRGGNFELYLITVATRSVERVTHFERRREGAHRSDDFDGFPMFSSDGQWLAFCSNRDNARPNETNVFIADWVE